MTTAGLVLVPVLLVAIWLAFQHKPAWYRPATLDEAGIQRAHADAASVADFVSERVIAGKPFELVLSDRQVNEWLTALPHQWPDAAEVLPPSVIAPAVAFEDGHIHFGAHYDNDDWQAIVSVTVTLALTDNDRSIRIALSGAHGGSLPVPRYILTNLLAPLVEAARRDRDPHTDQGDPDQSAGIDHDMLPALVGSVRSVGDLFEGVDVVNRSVWFNGRRPFRLDAVRIGDGQLRLRIEPL